MESSDVRRIDTIPIGSKVLIKLNKYNYTCSWNEVGYGPYNQIEATILGFNSYGNPILGWTPDYIGQLPTGWRNSSVQTFEYSIKDNNIDNRYREHFTKRLLFPAIWNVKLLPPDKQDKMLSASAKSNKLELAQKIISLLSKDEYVFGGYVRDALVVKKDFQDLDICCQDHYGFSNLKNTLRKAGIVCIRRLPEVKEYDSPVYRHAYKLTFNGTSVDVDFVIPIEDSPVMEDYLDADINALALKDGKIVSLLPSLDVEKVKKNILNNRFIPMEGMTEYRFEKFTTRGYSSMDKQQNSFFDMVKTDAKEAAYRVASSQMTKGTKAAIVSILQKQGHGSDRVQAISELLDSQFGDSLISLLLGAGLTYVPMFNEDPRAKKLAEEFRVNGMAVAGNAVIGVALENFLPVITQALAALPEEKTMDNKASENASIPVLQQKQQELEVVTLNQSRAQ